MHACESHPVAGTASIATNRILCILDRTCHGRAPLPTRRIRIVAIVDSVYVGRMRRPPALVWTFAACGPAAPALDDSSSGATQGPSGDPTSASSTTTATSTSDAADASTTPAEPTTDPTTSTTDPPGTCGPACAETWEHVGDLFIGPSTDPQTLACLRRIDGDLEIGQMTDGSVLAALANLEEVTGALAVQANPGLESLAGLECLRTVQRLTVQNNAGLHSLAALSGLRRAESLYLAGCPQLAELPQLALDADNLLIDVTLRDLGALTDLDALSGLHTASGQLFVGAQSCPALTSVAGIAGLLQGPSQLDVELIDLPALTGLAGLGGVPEFSSLRLAKLPLLASLTDLQGVQRINYLDIHSLARLAGVGGLESLVEADSLELHDLPVLADLAGLSGLTTVSYLGLDSLPALPDLSGLASLTSINQQLDLGTCDGGDDVAHGLDKIVDLTGLDSLEIAWNVVIADNAAFSGFAGAPNLKMVSEVHTVHNDALTEATVTQWLAGFAQEPSHCHSADFGMCNCFFLDP